MLADAAYHMSSSLNSLKGAYMGDYKGDTRSVDNGSYTALLVSGSPTAAAKPSSSLALCHCCSFLKW